MKYLLITIFCISSFFAHTSYGALHKCLPSKEYLDNNEPSSFSYSNNLLHKYTQKPFNIEEKIALYGTLMDTNCLPVKNARVQLWQVNEQGLYQYVPLRNIYDKKLFTTSFNTSFLNGGTTYTDNQGRFIFYTVVPKKINNNRAYFNLRFKTLDGSILQTKLFVQDAIISNKDIKHYEYSSVINLNQDTNGKF